MNAKAANNAPANTTVQPSAFGDATFGHGDGGATFGGGITFGPSTTFGSSWVSLHLVTQTVRAILQLPISSNLRLHLV